MADAAAPLEDLRRWVDDRPQYVFHPGRVAMRLKRGRTAATSAAATPMTLPWGVPLMVYPREALGACLTAQGVFDPCVSEALYRLVGPGETAIDVGANIGYMSSIMALRSGPSGAVLAFEPHPYVYDLLYANVRSWNAVAEMAAVRPRQLALSDHRGTGALRVSADFEDHMGLSTLAYGRDADPGAGSIEVNVERLDEVVATRQIGVLKIDVEGHEASVLRGATALLAERRVRDIIFEAHDHYPDEASEILVADGYTVMSMRSTLMGIGIDRPEARGNSAVWPGPSLLATTDPDRALALLRPRGWRLRGIGPTPPLRRPLRG